MRRLGTTALAALLLALAMAPVALAAPCPRTSLAEIENEVMCPVCKTPLALAEKAPQANRQRAFILARVERCESKAEIKRALVAEFGDEVLAMPETEGFDLAAYLVPAAALAAGLAGAAFAIVRWRRTRPRTAGATPLTAERARSAAAGTAEQSPEPSPSAAARLERDLERYDP